MWQLKSFNVPHWCKYFSALVLHARSPLTEYANWNLTAAMSCRNLQPDTFYPKHLLHQTPFTKTFFYKKHLYTKPIFCVSVFFCFRACVFMFVLICLCLWVCDCVCVCVCYFEYIARSHCWNVERTVPTTLYHSWNAQYKAGSHLGDAKHNVTRTFAQPLNAIWTGHWITTETSSTMRGAVAGIKIRLSPQFQCDRHTKFIHQSENVRRAKAVCIQKFRRVRFAQKMYESCVSPEFGAIDPPNPVRRFIQ